MKCSEEWQEEHEESCQKELASNCTEQVAKEINNKCSKLAEEDKNAYTTCMETEGKTQDTKVSECIAEGKTDKLCYMKVRYDCEEYSCGRGDHTYDFYCEYLL